MLAHWYAEETMRPRWLWVLLLLVTIGIPAAVAQDTTQDQASCVFEDGQAIVLRYTPAPAKETIPKGKVWQPGGKPMVLFTDVPFSMGNTQFEVGAYRVYVLNSGTGWFLILNKDVNPDAQYDVKNDILRVPLEAAQLPNPQAQTAVHFGRVAAKQCNLRIYHGRDGLFGAEFNER